MMVNSLRFCDTGMKLPSWVEQGRTELKVLHLLRLAAQRNPVENRRRVTTSTQNNVSV